MENKSKDFNEKWWKTENNPNINLLSEKRETIYERLCRSALEIKYQANGNNVNMHR